MRPPRVRKPSAKAKALNDNYTSLSTSPGPAIESPGASVPPSVPPFTETPPSFIENPSLLGIEHTETPPTTIENTSLGIYSPP